MSYTQQEIVKIYKQLVPSITESGGTLKIILRGQEFTVEKGRSLSQVVSSKNIGYR